MFNKKYLHNIQLKQIQTAIVFTNKVIDVLNDLDLKSVKLYLGSVCHLTPKIKWKKPYTDKTSIFHLIYKIIFGLS